MSLISAIGVAIIALVLGIVLGRLSVRSRDAGRLEQDLKKALQICQAAYTSQGDKAAPELTKTLIALGDYEYTLGNFTEAEELLKKAISLKEDTLKEKDAQYKELLNTYAKLLFKQNRTKEADEQYKKIKELG